MNTAIVHVVSDVFTRTTVCRRAVHVGPGMPVRGVLAAFGISPNRKLAAAIEGAGPVMHADVVRPGQVLMLAPQPGEAGTWIAIGIAILSAALSAYLASTISLPIAGSDEPEQRRYTFNRVSNNAFAGDTKPVVLGERRRYGGKVVAVVPEESADGSGDDKLNVLICYGRGLIGGIGNQAADFDALPATSLGEIDLNDQSVTAFTSSVRAWGRMGTDDQSPIPAFVNVQALREVGSGGVDLPNTSGTERTGGSASGEAFSFETTQAVNSFKVRVRLPSGLYSLVNNQLSARTVKYRQRYRTRADPGDPWGSYTSWQVFTVSKANQAAFWSSPRVRVDDAPLWVDIQMERVTVEVAATVAVDALRWDSVLEELDGEHTYAGHALLALELTAGEQIQNLPNVSAKVKGLSELRLWDGISPPSAPEFDAGWSSNPADLALEIITNDVFGMGARWGDENIDFVSLLAWRSYCAAAVARPASSGGGTRPRFACNLVLDSQKPALDWLRVVCGVGRCRPVLVGAKWFFIYDRPQDAPVEVFTDRSIVVAEDGAPAMSIRTEDTLGGRVRPNQFTAQIERDNENGDADTVSFPASEGANSLWLGGGSPEPANPEQFRLDGVTDLDQAADEVVYRGKRARYIARSIRLRTTRPWVTVQPGERFDVACNLDASVAISGGIQSGSTTANVRLDRDVTILAGLTYYLRVIHLGGTVESIEVSKKAGTVFMADGLDLLDDLDEAPEEGAEWVLEVPLMPATAVPYICTKVTCVDGEQLLWEVEGAQYVAGVFDPEPVEVTAVNTSYTPLASVAPGPVIDLRAFERINDVGAGVVELAWGQRPQDAAMTAGFRLYRRETGTSTWLLVPSPVIARRGAVVEITDLDRAYQFVVVPFSIGGSALPPDYAGHPIVSVAFGAMVPPPAPPTGLTAVAGTGNRYSLEWDAMEGAVEYQVLAGSVTTSLPNVGAEDALVLGRTTATEWTGLVLPTAKACRFFVRSVNVHGRLSFTASTVNVASPPTPAGQSVKDDKAFNFASEGTFVNCSWTASRVRMTDPTIDATWTSPEEDPGTLSLSELVFRALCTNDAEDADTDDLLFRVPSIEADQFGVIDDSPDYFGMTMPPYPDAAQQYLFEVRTHDGAAWSSWTSRTLYQHLAGTFQKWQIRITLRSAGTPYRPSIAALDVVVTE